MTWNCEAYGDTPPTAGEWCFFSDEINSRLCASPGICAAAMRAERRLAYQELTALSAAGNPVAQQVLDEITDPEQLLGGSAEQPRKR